MTTTTTNNYETFRKITLAQKNTEQIRNIRSARSMAEYMPEILAAKIVIRTITDGCSDDEERKSNKRERETLTKIFKAAFLAIGDFAGRNEKAIENMTETGEFIEETQEAIQSIMDQAEYTAHMFLPEKADGSRPNYYDSVYRPLAKIFQISICRPWK